MQNQMETGNVIVMTKRERMTRSHSQVPRPGDFMPEKGDTEEMVIWSIPHPFETETD